MSRPDQVTNHRVQQRRIYGVLAILASILTLAAIWNMPADRETSTSPAV